MDYQKLYDAFKNDEHYGDVYGNEETEDFIFVDWDEEAPEGYVYLRPCYLPEDRRNHMYYDDLTPNQFMHYCIVSQCVYLLRDYPLAIDSLDYGIDDEYNDDDD